MIKLLKKTLFTALLLATLAMNSSCNKDDNHCQATGTLIVFSSASTIDETLVVFEHEDSKFPLMAIRMNGDKEISLTLNPGNYYVTRTELHPSRSGAQVQANKTTRVEL